MKKRRAPPGSPPATPAKASRISSSARDQAEVVARGMPLTVMPGGDDWRFRVIGDDDFVADGVQQGAAQLPAIALVACFAGRAWVDYQHLADAAHQLVVGVAVQHEIRFGLAEPR